MYEKAGGRASVGSLGGGNAVAKMIRKQVYIEVEQDRRLKRQARALGVTEAELIRRGIEGIRVTPTLVPDERAWREERAFIRRRARLCTRGRERGWSREDLYADRTVRRRGRRRLRFRS